MKWIKRVFSKSQKTEVPDGRKEKREAIHVKSEIAKKILWQFTEKRWHNEPVSLDRRQKIA